MSTVTVEQQFRQLMATNNYRIMQIRELNAEVFALKKENQKLREAAQGLDSALDKYIEDTSKGDSE